MTAATLAADPPYTDVELASRQLRRERLPRHVAMIMDGNGRWAQRHGWPRIEGHRRGVQSVRQMVEECSRLGLEQLTLYCFSSENWKRPEPELRLLMHLLEQYLIEERGELMRQNLRFAVIGRRDGLGPGVLREIAASEDCTRDNTGMRLCLAVNYGSRAEITDAMQTIARAVAAGTLPPENITEATIANALYTANMPDPVLLLRTAGEMRISNYLLWQISYAEFWVTDKCWPEFEVADLHSALRDYAARDRRFGGLSS